MQPPTLSQLVFFCDDTRTIHVAIVTAAYPPRDNQHEVNLVYFQPNGRYKPAFSIKRAEYDGSKWRLLNRWFTSQEDEFDTSAPNHLDLTLFNWPYPSQETRSRTL